MPVSKPYIKASIKSIARLKVPSVEGKPDFKFSDPICRISGSRYLMSISFDDDSYIPAIKFDISTLSTRPIEDLSDGSIHAPQFMLTRNKYITYVFSGFDGILMLKDDKLHVKIEFKHRYRLDKNFHIICDRWNQQFGVDVYMIDRQDHLYSLCWTDIEQNIPVVLKIIDSLVEDFCVTNNGMAILYTNGDLKLPGSIMVESKIMPADAIWSTIIKSSNR